MPTAAERTRAKVLAVVAAIPAGRVTTYGAIARRIRSTPRLVARVLASFSPEESRTLPWHRVVAAGGVVSTLRLGAVGRDQVSRLQAEGVAVSLRGKVSNFKSVFWRP